MSGWAEVHVPPPPDGSSGVTRWELAHAWRWELGEELIGSSWVRRVRVVRVTDTGPFTREYTLRELDDGHQVFQSEADEEVFDPHRVVRALAVQQGREGVVPEGRHEDGQQVGGCDGASRRQQEHGPDLEGSDREVGRQEADGEGFDGSVESGRVREEQAGLIEGCGGTLAEGPVLGEVYACCTPWARVEPVCEGCPIWGGPAGVSADRVVLADDRGLDVVHVECGGGGSGGLSGSGRLSAPQGGDRVLDLRPPPWTASPIVPVPPVGQDLLRLRDEDVAYDPDLFGGAPR